MKSFPINMVQKQSKTKSTTSLLHDCICVVQVRNNHMLSMKNDKQAGEFSVWSWLWVPRNVRGVEYME